MTFSSKGCDVVPRIWYVSCPFPASSTTSSGAAISSAWTASAEYRLPLAFIARGYRLRPLFLDRMSATFFVDAGNATCTDEQRAVYLSCAGNSNRPDDVLLAGGFEVAANVAALLFVPTWVRLGIGFPFVGTEKQAQVYLTFTPSF